MEFVVDRDADLEVGREQGTFFYEKGSATTGTFTTISGQSFTLGWPTQMSFNRYEYTRIGETSGRVTFYGDSGPVVDPSPDAPAPSVFGGLSEANPAIMTILFNTDGGSEIVSLEMTMQVRIADIYYTGEFAGQITTLDGSPVGEAYFNDPSQQPSPLTDGRFDGDFLTLTDTASGDDLELVFAGGSDGQPDFLNSDRKLTEQGITTINNTTQNLVYEANYTLKQPVGTNDVIMSLEYTGGEPDDLPATEEFILNFLSDENGNYTSDLGNGGTFTFYATGALGN